MGRNDPCPCGSGKKYKKCCEAKNGRKKMNAHLLTDTTDLTQKVKNVTNLFHTPPKKLDQK